MMMSQQIQHFPKAPIVEAIVGIDLEEMLGDDSLGTLQELGNEFLPMYPTREPMIMGEFKFEIGSQPKQVETQLGYFFKAKDGLQIIHARRNGFAFSRLAPYQNWALFIAEAKRTWALYRHAIGPSKLMKWTVRYINKLSWPESEPIEKYFNVYPHVPENLPQNIQGCFMRLQVPIDSPQQGLLTQQLVQVPPDLEGMVSFVLDNEFDFAAIGLNDSELWEKIQSCRNIKNQFFMNSITDKTKEMIS